MIGIWYVPKKNKVYAKYVRSAYFHKDYVVGYVNQYNHELIALFYISNKNIIQCKSLTDYYNIKRENGTFKKRLINRIIYLLNKLK